MQPRTLSKFAIVRSLLCVGAVGVLSFSVQRQRDRIKLRQLQGKVALITGGSRGLGLTIAGKLATLGVRLVLTARDGDELARAKAHLIAQGGVNPDDIFVKVSDVSRVAEISEVIAAATGHFGRIDIVINNAGIILVGPVESQTLSSFQQAMNINFFGAVHTTLAVLPQMLARGQGSIVNIASIGGKVAMPHLLPYVASKFALVGWSEGLRAELSQRGLQVTTVTPGLMRTGSHVQARFAGNGVDEYRWFAISATLPFTAVSASRAAQKIVRAVARGEAEISIGAQAVVAGRLAGLMPKLTARLLALVASLLPGSPASLREGMFWEADRSVPGRAYHGELGQVLEGFGDRAIEQYNQQS